MSASSRTKGKTGERELAALDWRTGHYVDEHGVELFIDERASVAQMLDQLPLHTERVLLTGDRPHDDDIAAFRAWVTEPVDGWEPRHYLERTTRPVMEWRTEGRHVELIRAASWFGDTDAGPVEVLDAMLRTRQMMLDVRRLLDARPSTPQGTP